MFLRLVVVCMLGQAWSLPKEPQPLQNHSEVRAVQSSGIDGASLLNDLGDEVTIKCPALAAALIKILVEHGIALTTTEEEVSLKKPEPLENHRDVRAVKFRFIRTTDDVDLSEDLYVALDGSCRYLAVQVMHFLDKHGITEK